MKYEKEAIFVLRRAWLFGACSRADIARAFDTDTSPNRARDIIRYASEAGGYSKTTPYLVYIKNKGVFPNRSMPWPELADPALILDLIARREPPEVTGVWPDDGVTWFSPAPIPTKAGSPESLRRLLVAIVNKEPIWILYAGLRKGETARWRRVYPRGMEHTGLYWRMHAQDMEESHGFPIKVFVVGRILETRAFEESDMPENFQSKELIPEVQTLHVQLSDALTKEQKEGMRQTFGMDADGKMILPVHAVHGFSKEYADAPVGDTIVWPVIQTIRK